MWKKDMGGVYGSKVTWRKDVGGVYGNKVT